MGRPLNIDILTLFPRFFVDPLAISIVGKAVENGIIDVSVRDIRDWAEGDYRQVDDMPYGGGPGMVLMLEPIVKCVESVLGQRRDEGLDPVMVILCPRGERLMQPMLEAWARMDPRKRSLLVLAGHYEGYDERLYSLFPWQTVSLGDFVLSGGEVPALAIVDGVARLLDGALGNPESLSHESFTSGCLDHPVYTRPPEYRGMKVPEVLLGGDHARIETWRTMKRKELTSRFRPDLMNNEREDDLPVPE
jgi:tRNA (guanine37-N1)-methyltransferase